MSDLNDALMWAAYELQEATEQEVKDNMPAIYRLDSMLQDRKNLRQAVAYLKPDNRTGIDNVYIRYFEDVGYSTKKRKDVYIGKHVPVAELKNHMEAKPPVWFSFISKKDEGKGIKKRTLSNEEYDLFYGVSGKDRTMPKVLFYDQKKYKKELEKYEQIKSLIDSGYALSYECLTAKGIDKIRSIEKRFIIKRNY